MNFYHLISKFVPEGKKKNKFREFFYKVLYSVNLGSKKIEFEKGITGKFKRLLLINREESFNELRGYILNYKPKKGDVVIDAGAFQGHFAVYASKLVGSEGKVICFEPEEANFKLLKKNIKINKLKNVILIKGGLWNKNEILKFKSHGPDSRLEDFEEGKEDCLITKIKVVSLDYVLDKLNIKKVNFVKMDIEGAEIKAIKGMENLMKKNKINFAIASYHEVDGEKTCKKLEKMFKKSGYAVKTEYPLHLTTYAHK